MRLKITIGLIAAIVMLFSGCFDRNGEENDPYTYTMNEQIINPPDSFRLVMNLRPNTTLRTFFHDSASSVWKIVKQQASNRPVWVKRTDSSERFYINQDTVGLKANIQYQIFGSNNIYDEQRLVYVKFIRLPLDYETFPNKL